MNRLKRFPLQVGKELQRIEPQYLIKESDYLNWPNSFFEPKISYMRIGSATNSRSMIATVLLGMPCEVNASTMRFNQPTLEKNLLFESVINSLTFEALAKL